jgi:RNA polymerase sigma-70 factor (ECF subfamily)
MTLTSTTLTAPPHTSTQGMPDRHDSVDPEVALLARLRAGDEAAFDTLVRQYQQPLTRFVLRLVGDADDTTDVVQETFIRAFERIDDFRGGAALYTWLYRIAHNQSISLLRRRRVRRFLRLDSDEGRSEAVELQLVDGDDAAARYEETQAVGQIEAAIEELPPRQRGIFVMRHYEGLSLAEIARVLGRSEGAIRAGYFHAVRKLRDRARETGLVEEERT